MALAHVQGVAASTAGNTFTSLTSPAFASTAGNLLVVNAGVFQSQTITVDDNNTNTYATAVAVPTSGGANLGQFYAKNIVGRSGHTVTMHSGAGAFLCIGVIEVSGADLSSPFEAGQAVGQQAGSGTRVTPSITTVFANCIIIAGINSDISASPVSAAVSPETLSSHADSTSSAIPIANDYQIVAVAGSYAGHFTYTPDAASNDGKVTGAYRAAPSSVQKFYLHDAATADTGTLPGATSAASLGTSPTATGASTNRNMDGLIGVGPQIDVSMTLSAGSSLGWFRRFLSAPLAAQTVSAANWTFEGGFQVSAPTAGDLLSWGLILWRPSSGAVVATILAGESNSGVGTTPSGSNVETNEGPTAAAGAGFTSEDGDILVLEIFDLGGTLASSVDHFFYDGTTEGSASTNAAFLQAPVPLNLSTGLGPPPQMWSPVSEIQAPWSFGGGRRAFRHGYEGPATPSGLALTQGLDAASATTALMQRDAAKIMPATSGGFVTIAKAITPSPMTATSATSVQVNKLLPRTLSVTTASALTLLRQVNRVLTTASASVASVVRAIGKGLTTSSPSTPSIKRAVAKTLSLSSASAVSMLASRFYQRALTASSVALASVIKQISKPLTASSVTALSIIRNVGKILTLSSASVTTINKQLARTLTTTSATTATLARVLLRLLSASSASVATLTKRVGKPLTANSGSVSQIVKSLTKLLNATSASTATMIALKVKLVTMAVVTATTASVVKLVGKPLTVSSVTAVSLLRVITKTLTASSSTVATNIKKVGKNLTSTSGSVATVAALRVQTIFLTVASATVASVRKAATKSLTVSSGSVGSLVRDVRKSLAVASATIASVTRARLVTLNVVSAAVASFGPKVITKTLAGASVVQASLRKGLARVITAVTAAIASVIAQLAPRVTYPPPVLTDSAIATLQMVDAIAVTVLMNDSATATVSITDALVAPSTVALSDAPIGTITMVDAPQG